MNEPLYFDDVEVGDEWNSGSRTVTETDVIMFAGMTGDFNPLHVDRNFASQTPFGQPIAHGLLGVAWVAGLGSHAPEMRTEAFVAIHEWRFLQPLLIGTTVHVRTRLAEKTDKNRRRGAVLWRRELVDQDGKVLQSGIFESLVTKRPAPSKPE